MRTKIKNAAKKVGLPPGTLLPTCETRSDQVKIWLHEYNEGYFEEQVLDFSAFEGCAFDSNDTVTWLHVTGVHSASVVEKLGHCFNLHPLVMEDILNTNHRPKLEDYSDYTFLVAKAIYCQENGEYKTEQISMVLGSSYIISFQESSKPIFEPVLTRLKGGKGRIRRMGADYLAYALVDTIVDNYFVLLEDVGEKIEQLEERLIIEPDRQMLNEIYSLKTEMLYMRKAIWPLREIVNALERGDSKFFKESTLLYMRDVYDHTIQVIDTLETYREMVTGMLDIYLSSVSHKLNEVMKVLTIISTIFIPLTFLAGVYGMNFKYMPELEWEWGYPLIWTIMITSVLFMVRYFRQKKWM